MNSTIKTLGLGCLLLASATVSSAQANYWNLGSGYFDCTTGAASPTPSAITDVYPDAFAVPGLCNTYYRVYWQNANLATPHFNYLTLFDVSSNPAGHPLNSLSPANQTDLINTGTTHAGNSVAVAPLSTSGDRSIFAVEDGKISQFTVYSNGTISAATTFYSGSLQFDNNIPAEVSADGKYLICVDVSENICMFDIPTGTMTAYTVPKATNTNGLAHIAGFEYVDKWPSLGTRLYVSYNDPNAWPSPAGGIGYFDLATSTFSTVPNYPPGLSDYDFGFTEIEYAKNGKLYMAERNAGTIYSYDNAGNWNGVATVWASRTARNGVDKYLETQIDGEDYDAAYYGAPSITGLPSISGTSSALSPMYASTAYRCPNGSLALQAPVVGLMANTTFNITPGVITGNSFLATSGTFSVSQSGTGAILLYDLGQVPQLDGYTGALRIAINLSGPCGNGSTQVYYINIQNASATIAFDFNTPGGGTVASSPTPVVVGATSGSISNIGVSTTGMGTITNYKLEVIAPGGTSLGAQSSSTFFLNSNSFDNITGGYFTSNYSSYIGANPTFMLDYSVTTTNCGTAHKYAWFKILPGNVNARMMPISTSNETLQLSPNPASGMVQLNWSVSKEEVGQATLQLSDMLGRQVLRQQWTEQSGTNQQFFDIHALADGVYMYSFQNGSTATTGRLIKK